MTKHEQAIFRFYENTIDECLNEEPTKEDRIARSEKNA
jgi:hypothetical protein